MSSINTKIRKIETKEEKLAFFQQELSTNSSYILQKNLRNFGVMSHGEYYYFINNNSYQTNENTIQEIKNILGKQSTLPITLPFVLTE